MQYHKKLAEYVKRNARILKALASGKSKSEVAREHGISRERVGQIEKKAKNES